MSLVRRILITSTGVGVVRVGGMGLAFVVQLLLARVLGVSGFGQFAFALAWLQVLSVPASVGMQTAGARFVAEYLGSPGRARLVAFLRFQSLAAMIGGIALAGAMILVVALLSGRLSPTAQSALYVSAITLPLAALALALQGALRGMHRQVLAEATDRLVRPLALVTVPAAAILFAVQVNAATAMAAQLLGTAVIVAVEAAIVVRVVLGIPRDAELEPRAETRRWVRAGFSMMLLSGMAILLNRVDVLMLGSVVGAEAAGIYTASGRLAELASMALAVSNTVVAPLISRYHAEGRRHELQLTLTRLARIIALVAVGVFIGAAFLGEYVLAFFGQDFRAGYWAVLILIGGQLVNAACGPVGFLAIMTDNEGAAAKVQAGALGLNVALNALLIPRLGLEGAAIATAVSIAASNLMLLILVRRRLGMDPSVMGNRRRA